MSKNKLSKSASLLGQVCRATYCGLLAALTFAGTAQNASAADWVKVSESETGSVVLVDRDSIKLSKDENDAFDLWIMIDAAEDETISYLNDKIYTTIYCEDDSYSIRESIRKYENKIPVVKVFEFSKRPIPPESTWEKIQLELCKIKNSGDHENVRPNLHNTHFYKP